MTTKRVVDLTQLTGAGSATDDDFLVWDKSASAHKRISRAELRIALEAAGLIGADGNGDVSVPRYVFAAAARFGTAPTTWQPVTTSQGITTVEVAAGADGKNWDTYVSAGVLYHRTINDAYSAAATYYTVTRSGNTISEQAWYLGSTAEKMRLNSTGLGIGGAASLAKLEVSAADGSQHIGIRGTTRGIRFVSSSTACSIEGVSADLSTSYQPLHINGSYLGFLISGAETFRMFAGGFRPSSDAAVNNGDPSYRWGTVYAATGSINTSGRDAKVGIRAPSDAERRAARRILDGGPKLYRFREAYDAKGDAARLHAGYIAEDVRDALEAEGLDPWQYGFMCADEITAPEPYTVSVERPKVRKMEVSEKTVEIVDGQPTLVTKIVEREEPVGRMVPVVDEAGHVVVRPVADQQGERMEPILHFVPEVETVLEARTREVPTGETRLGLRYSELEAFLKAAA